VGGSSPIVCVLKQVQVLHELCDPRLMANGEVLEREREVCK